MNLHSLLEHQLKIWKKKNTAGSNHLTQLIENNLIEKDYGIYRISGDGIEFMKAIDQTFQKSPTRQLKKFQDLQSRKISNSFINRFNPQNPIDGKEFLKYKQLSNKE